MSFKAARVTVASLVLAALLAVRVLPQQVALAAYPSCNSTDGHYRANAVSGTSSNGGDIGTGAQTTSWGQWSVQPNGGSLEQVWLVDKQSPGYDSSIEADAVAAGKSGPRIQRL
jgi:hypothetical protein